MDKEKRFAVVEVGDNKDGCNLKWFETKTCIISGEVCLDNTNCTKGLTLEEWREEIAEPIYKTLISKVEWDDPVLAEEIAEAVIKKLTGEV